MPGGEFDAAGIFDFQWGGDYMRENRHWVPEDATSLRWAMTQAFPRAER